GVGENTSQGRRTRRSVAYQHAWGSSSAWPPACIRSWPGDCWTPLSRQAAWQDVGEREHAARFPPPLRCVTDEHGTRDVLHSALGAPRFLDLHPPHAAYGTCIRAGVWRERCGDRVHRRTRCGSHGGCNWPCREKAHTASPDALPIDCLAPVALGGA